MEELINIFKTANAYSEKSRREGFLSLEENLENLENLDENILSVFKHGLKLALDGVDSQIIDKILSNIIEREKNKKALRIKKIQKEAVLGIHAGCNTRILTMKLLSFLNKNESKVIESEILNDDLFFDSDDLNLDGGASKHKHIKPEQKIVLKQSDFIKQTADILRITYLFSGKARREGLLALEDELEDIDYEFLKKGLRLVVDGTDNLLINDILSNEIDIQQDETYKRFLTIKKEAVLNIQQGDSPDFHMHKLISFLNNSELKQVKESLSTLDFFTKNNFNDSGQFEKEAKKFTIQAANILQRAYKFSEKSSKYSLLSLDENIDKEKKADRDILEYGIQFAADGVDPYFINYILSNMINLEDNKEIKRLKLMQKEAVMGICGNENPAFVFHTLLSFFTNNELEEIKKKFANSKFKDSFEEILNNPQGSQEEIERMEKNYLDELENSAGSREVIDFFNKPLDILKDADQERVQELIKNENPQAAASLIAWHSSGCFSEGGVETIVNILKNTDSTTEKRIVKKWNEENPELAQEVLKRIFLFEDIVLLDDRAVQKVFREVDSQDLAIALKGTNENVQDKIFKNLSKRAGSMLKEDMEYMGPVRTSSVNESQRKIALIVKNLEYSDEIEISK